MRRSTLFALALAALAPATASATNLRIALKTDDGDYVVAQNGGGAELAADRSERGAWETFTLYDIDGGALEHGDQVALRAADGHFVSAEGGGGRELVANRDRAQSWERFVIHRDGGNGTVDDGSKISLQSASRKFLSARGGSLKADLDVITGGNERFRVVVVDRMKHAKLSAPFAKPSDFSAPIGFDHNRDKHKSPTSCTGFYGEGFPNCYDNHEGTDYMLKGWFPGMDLRKNEVIAAAPGIVIGIADGNADHCFAFPSKAKGEWDLAEHQIQCPGNPELEANVVSILQDDGDIARYYHLKKGSVVVGDGQRIECGMTLGLVGSSGVSSSPHLHFQLERDDAWIDPYKVDAWAKLKDKVPQRTCNAPAAPATPGQQMCNVVERVFSCSNQPAKAICDGVQSVTGGCIAKDWSGKCITTCADVCGTIERTVTKPCG
ncbi:MAG TPA: peptidoglycan DD-metalloendopeptidase family protein [Nannocystaceae bacterium]|nr:peptidoglycan DD-metalloendopeptidase family protein [Nannocystaceae bacterium]